MIKKIDEWLDRLWSEKPGVFFLLYLLVSLVLSLILVGAIIGAVELTRI